MVNQLVEKNEKKEIPQNGEQFAAKMKGFYARIKSVKHIKIIAAALLLAAVVLAFASLYKPSVRPAAAAGDPLRELETKLADMLSAIKGAGKVSVMIMYDGGMEIVTAESKSVTTNKTTDTSGGADRITENTTETSTPIIINEGGKSKPIILKEIMPEILGVMIVAEGADNVSVRMELLKAAAGILDVNADIIEIFTMQK
jgi:stage III sporulation protein AG